MKNKLNYLLRNLCIALTNWENRNSYLDDITFRRYNIETIHKPTKTIKSYVCNKTKDKIHDLDQTGVVYHIKCKRHKTDYVGETERVWRSRLYEHRVINHKEANRSHSINKDEKQISNEEKIGTRKSSRQKEIVNYKKMNSGSEIMLTEGNTEVSSHIATEEHSEGDIEFEIIGKENNWHKRGITEAIAIKERKSRLNEDEGRYRLPAIYDNIIRSQYRVVKNLMITEDFANNI